MSLRAGRDIPAQILAKNLVGLEIDERAAQLAAFALLMKALNDDRNFFTCGVRPRVLALRESNGLDASVAVATTQISRN